MRLFSQTPHTLPMAAPFKTTDRDSLARAYARLFASDDGKLILSHLQALTFGRTGHCESSDSELRYAEGQRALVAKILRLIDQGRG